MTSSRGTSSLWWHIKHKRNPLHIFTQKNKRFYFWQDNFWTYWNRLIGCRISGHRLVPLTDDGFNYYNFCFKCYRKIGKVQRVGFAKNIIKTFEERE